MVSVQHCFEKIANNCRSMEARIGGISGTWEAILRTTTEHPSLKIVSSGVRNTAR
jgi:hypothetical protein